MVARGYRAHVLGQADHRFSDPVAGVQGLMRGGAVSDQHLPAWVAVDEEEGRALGAVQDGTFYFLFFFFGNGRNHLNLN